MALFNQIGIIGLGLMGGSILQAAYNSRERVAKDIAVFDTNELAVSHFARELGVIPADSLAQIAQSSDLLIIATPIDVLEKIAPEILQNAPEKTVICDICSVKRPFLNHFESDKHVVIPAHPIAGSEKKGYANANEIILRNKLCVLSPAEKVDSQALEKLTRFWQLLGMQTSFIPAELHDEIYAYVSHLPQFLAFCARNVLGEIEVDYTEYQKFARLQNSDNKLWHSIFESNRDNLITAVKDFLTMAEHIMTELEQGCDQIGEGDAKAEEEIVKTILFPRIISSCLIGVIDMLEKRSGQRIINYAGPGFIDFTAPALSDPEKDIELISGNCNYVNELNKAFIAEVKDKIKVYSG